MEFTNKVKMSLNDWRQFKDDENISLAFGNVTFLSTKPNSHKHLYSEDVIRQYAPSYLGQMIVAEYDSMTNDTTTHTDDKLNIVGYIPSNQEVQYYTDEEGYFNASVDVVISKIYAIDVYNLFKSKDTKSVSVEQLVGFTDETKDLIDGIDEKVVIGFEGVGITILGEKFKPSVPNANIKMVKMSADEFESEYQKHNIKISEDNKMDEILNKLTSIEEKLSKEEIMADNKSITKYAVSIGDDLWGKIYSALKEKYPINDDGWITSKYRIIGIYEEGGVKFTIVEERDGSKKFKVTFELTETELTLGEDLVEVKAEFIPVEMEMFTLEEFSKYEETIKTEELAKVDEVEEPKEDEMAEPEVKEDETEMACGDGDKEKMAELENKLAEAEGKIEKYEVELSELKEFKNKMEAIKCQEIIDNTLSIAKKVVDESKYTELETESKECVYATVETWAKDVKASISEIAIAKMEAVKLSAREDDVVDMGIPTHVEKTKKTIYD